MREEIKEKIEHRWVKDENTGWWHIYCEVEHDLFSPKCESFEDAGRCPLCGAGARNELDIRKRKKEEIERRAKMKKEIALKNTLEVYF